MIDGFRSLGFMLRIFLLALPCFLPIVHRVVVQGWAGEIGLVSDLVAGSLLFGILLGMPRLLRVLILLCWFLLQLGSLELLAATKRLPAIQDIHYLVDPTFLAGSTAGFHFAAPYYTAGLVIAIVLALWLGPRQKSVVLIICSFVAALLGLWGHSYLERILPGQEVSYRYSPAHWLIVDFINSRSDGLPAVQIPQEIFTALLWNAQQGERLLPVQKPTNVLIVTLEGIPGITIPEISRAVGVGMVEDEMQEFAGELQDAMLIPDFTVHSHQTIRGLYAIHCGDFSKLSYGMPKAFELQMTPDRAAACLPAQLVKYGWQTHFLQGAPLQFMNKDRAMPVMGFQEVHGLEWFHHRTATDFIWGTTDPDFFQGAKEYITELRQQQKPWLLSLLTVATHQPFAASDNQVRRYGSRKRAAMAELDASVADFIRWLRNERVFNDTLVIFTSDESHGAELGDWPCSWGYAAVFASGGKTLPHLKVGSYGLLDMEASVLDYFGLPAPAQLRGRSFFRDYTSGRHMFSYTANKLRWQDPDHGLLECSQRTNCLYYPAGKMIGPRPEAKLTGDLDPALLYSIAAALDNTLQSRASTRVLDFGNGEVRDLPEKIRSEWTDNLVGAQYLEFPAGSRVKVDISVQALGSTATTVHLRLIPRQFEKEVGTIAVPQFPELKNGESASVSFSFDNPKKRQAFSFHFVGEGKDAKLRINTFRLTITDTLE
jgi:hypothetical protein